ncbi:hypothetical protein GA0061099_102912 [Bradyrhizobium yuanmingense]|uniref:Uncharacterized protein n=1 Tax=Bradyrhizobium yuanmingense TaxID=108015 RepID=A0A1C3XIT9_9BRAD|nr:hypothetical protein IQ15_07383 [Bradyrhizobium yuanmingense]SCB52201.1 hypothetical protein GA0061099_102912 [Bradyrhizobium yuanmingense]
MGFPSLEVKNELAAGPALESSRAQIEKIEGRGREIGASIRNLNFDTRLSSDGFRLGMLHKSAGKGAVDGAAAAPLPLALAGPIGRFAGQSCSVKRPLDQICSCTRPNAQSPHGRISGSPISAPRSMNLQPRAHRIRRQWRTETLTHPSRRSFFMKPGVDLRHQDRAKGKLPNLRFPRQPAQVAAG